jgi:hypothetical protein
MARKALGCKGHDATVAQAANLQSWVFASFIKLQDVSILVECVL